MVSVKMPLPMILNHKMNLRRMNLVDSSTMLNFFVTFQQLGTNDKTMWSPFKCELLFLTKSAMFKEGEKKKKTKKTHSLHTTRIEWPYYRFPITRRFMIYELGRF